MALQERRYPAYKDSGVPWLGEIPAHWEVVRLKWVAQLRYGDALPEADRQEGDVPVLGSNGEVGRHSTANTQAPVVVIGRKGSYGKVVYSPEPVFAIDTTFYVDDLAMHDARWFYYNLCALRLDSFSEDSAVPGLSREYVHSRALPLPPRDEQRAIAEYLDDRTARIDALVDRYRRLIALLQERRAALITHAVTRGLDPAAPLKDSGAPWLREIPAHWEVVRLKWVTEVNPSPPPMLDPELTVSFLPMDAIGVQGELELSQEIQLADASDGYTYFQTGDVIVAKITPCFENGKGALADGLTNNMAFGTTELHVVRPGDLVDSRFLYLVTTSRPFRRVGTSYMNGAAGQKRIPTEYILEYPLPLPPLPEQRAIAEYLDGQTARIDVTVARAERMIALLQEYRAALITAAVTGRIRVT